MKKGIMSSFIILGVLLSGCGSQKEELYSSSNPVDITVWTYYNGDQLSSFNTLVKKFNRTQGKENGIYVESVSCGTVNDLEKNLKDSIEKKVGASEIPDMFSAYNDIAYTIDQMHGIVDLNKYFSDDELDEYIEGYVQDGDILNNGKLKVFPVAKSTEILTINKTDFDIFAKATNVSSKDLSTIEGLVEVSQKLSISKPRIENKNQACYCIDTQMNSNICTVFIVTIHLFQTQIIGKESKMNNTTNR